MTTKRFSIWPAPTIPWLVVAAFAPSAASADPLRLRGDALASAQAPAGLVTLEGSDRARPWLDAEASLWFGAGDDATADALVMVVKLRDPKRRGSLRIGRQIVTAGALRPVHLDGIDSTVRLSSRATLEAFAGLPVVRSFGVHAWDWVAGARGAYVVGNGVIGLSWLEQRDGGLLHTHELAADGAWPIGKRIDIASGVAMDLINPGLAEARVSAAWRTKSLRAELFATQRRPSHLLPATSLFSVLGDVPATKSGVATRWRAAPRLDVMGTLGVRVADGDVDEDLNAGARLRLDDKGASSVGLDLRRQGSPDGGWTGIRGVHRIALADEWTYSNELELVIPDNGGDRGRAWPWGLAAISWRRPSTGWELAGAVEMSSSPMYHGRIDALLRLSRAWQSETAATATTAGKRGAP